MQQQMAFILIENLCLVICAIMRGDNSEVNAER